MLDDVPRLRDLVARWFVPGMSDPPLRAAALVRRLNVHGLLSYGDAMATADGWDPIVRRALADARLASARHSLALALALRQVVEVARSTGVRLLTMKGVALSAALHVDIGWRQSGDVDVLIAPGDLATLVGGLGDARFEPEAPWRGATPRDVDAMSSTGQVLAFTSPTGVTVEVHTALAPSRVAVFDALWSRHRLVVVANHPVPTLSWPDTIVHLASHGFRHAWCRLSWLCDIAHVAGRDDIDWLAASARALDGRQAVALEGAVIAARDVLGAPLPARLRISARGERAGAAVAARIGRGVLNPGGMTLIADRWRCCDSAGDAAAALWQEATSVSPADVPDGARWPPPPFTRWVRRPVRLVRRYVFGRREANPGVR